MSISKKAIVKSSVLVSIFSMLGASIASSNAEPTGYNKISFSVEASQEVENDEVTATLYKKAQAKTSKQLATELNNAINMALTSTKRYPTVTATTGAQNTYPKYNDNGKITGWTGSVSINLKSKDFVAASNLISDLQSDFVMQGIQFGVSEPKKDKIEKELMVKASHAFKEQAKAMVEAWDTSGYQILEVSLNTHGNYNYNPRPVMMSRAMESESVPAQNFEGGNSDITVVANGAIELIPFRK